MANINEIMTNEKNEVTLTVKTNDNGVRGHYTFQKYPNKNSVTTIYVNGKFLKQVHGKTFADSFAEFKGIVDKANILPLGKLSDVENIIQAAPYGEMVKASEVLRNYSFQNFKVNTKNRTVSATIYGGGEPYTVSIRFTSKNEILPNCSCPNGAYHSDKKWDKHTLALALFYKAQYTV